MKITVNYFQPALSLGLIISGLIVSGCAPANLPQMGVPQAYPVMPQPPARVQPAPQPQYQVVTPVPQAAPLPQQQYRAPRAPAVQRYAAVPTSRPQIKVQRTPRPQARIDTPPTLRPTAQQNRIPSVSNRPAPSVTQATPAQQQNSDQGEWQDYNYYSARPGTAGTARPSASARRPAVPPIQAEKQSSAKDKVSSRADTAPASATPTTTTAPQNEQVEVLDMSGKIRRDASVNRTEQTVPAPPAIAYGNNPAVVILTKQANNQLVAGKTDRAAATLERALRIAPDNPMLWLRLAEVNEQQGNKTQAASMAKKAITLAPDDAGIKQRGQRLLN